MVCRQNLVKSELRNPKYAFQDCQDVHESNQLELQAPMHPKTVKIKIIAYSKTAPMPKKNLYLKKTRFGRALQKNPFSPLLEA